MHMFTCSFCRERFSNSWRTKQVDDEAMSFTLDKIVKIELVVVRLNQRFQEIFASWGEDEVGEG